MHYTWKKTAASCLMAALLLVGAARALADGDDDSDYGYAPGPFYSGQIPGMGWGMGMDQGMTLPYDGILYNYQPEDNSYYAQQERTIFHPGYADWDSYYANPPWMNRDESDFHPYWMGR